MTPYFLKLKSLLKHVPWFRLSCTLYLLIGLALMFLPSLPGLYFYVPLLFYFIIIYRTILDEDETVTSLSECLRGANTLILSQTVICIFEHVLKVHG